ncbi:MAG: outer membrane lipoprotein carrier protein LolA [candidate division WOR-3 bacterium]|nr:outer membrane lipoprotein carrier protein LolA [candidate division WOR-3 bacterium]MCX7948300.1 outer membrane lipoprotein carrier protein LolA [candidate division WOR-3 bacterium]MDW8151154.1 outer membrane lipoprotein carrier protein LolA [candidate division WOR-3 bacterium]
MIIFILSQSIEDIQKKYLKIKYLRASYVHTTKTKQGNSITYKGYLTYSAPSTLEFHTTEPEEQKIIFKDTMIITIIANDTTIQTIPKDMIFNPYYFLIEGYKNYKSELRKDENYIDIFLNSDRMFYKNVHFRLRKNDYALIKVKANDINGMEYEFELKDIIQK